MDPEDGDARDAYYALNFGAFGTEWLNLSQAKFFGDRTGQDSRGLEALLSIREFAPTRSANVTVYENSPPGNGKSSLRIGLYQRRHIAGAQYRLQGAAEGYFIA